MHQEQSQPPSKRRRQIAREHGYVVHSPELAAAVGWTVAVVVLWLTCDHLVERLVELVQWSLDHATLASTDPAELVAHFRRICWALSWPLAITLGAFAGGALAVHGLEVRRSLATRRLAPDPGRLWAITNAADHSVRGWYAAWTLIKAAVLGSATAWAARAEWSDILRLSGLEDRALAYALGRKLLHAAVTLAAALLALGMVDFGLRYRRFEKSLRTTPQQHRDDQRVIEGDRTTRAQRRRLARSWCTESPKPRTGTRGAAVR
jgi:flagellar biosynthetic protein FlhB